MTENNNLVRSITEDADCVWIRGVPNDRQKQFFASKARFIAYGGARGGGKSWALRKKLPLMCLKYPGIKILLLRRTYPDLFQNHTKVFLVELDGIATYSDKNKMFKFVNGSELILGYCATERDALQYQGQEYDVIGFDEATGIEDDLFRQAFRLLIGFEHGGELLRGELGQIGLGADA